MRYKRRQLYHDGKIAGEGGAASWASLDKHQIPPFNKLFEKIKTRIGNYEKARKYIGFSNDEMSNMKAEKKLSANKARHLLRKYHELFPK